MSVVTGYLGSGKTTLINRLLANSDGQRITVLVNDFGEISLDAELIENRDGDIISLANGCMCCQIGGDLYRTIDRILSLRSEIDHVVVETSGVADPSKISQIAAAEPDLSDNGTLVLVDTVNFAEQFQNPSLRDTLERQIAKADLVLLTKLDMESKEGSSSALETLNEVASDCQLVASIDEGINQILKPEGFRKIAKPSVPVEPLKPHLVPFDSWTWQGTEKLSRHRLMALLEDSALNIYRCKGLVCFEDGSSAVVNKVGETIRIDPIEAALDRSILTVIGVTPGFSRTDFKAEWQRSAVVCDLVSPQAGNAHGG